jgi:L-threonylcarbamoyladenylate synthase
MTRSRVLSGPVRVLSVIDARKESHARVAEEVASVVFGGGTVIFPTDTVYGIGCDPYNLDAIAKIYGAKDRPRKKPLSLHLASLNEFLEYVGNRRQVAAAGRRLMPGPVTIIIPKPAFIDREVTSGRATLGFRVPDDPLCMTLMERCGPLAATSANISGERAYYGGGDWQALPAADLLVENGPTRYQRDSTVIDMTGMQPIVLREGVVSLERLTELLGPVGLTLPPIRKTP